MTVCRGAGLLLGTCLLVGVAVTAPVAKGGPAVARLGVERASDAAGCDDAAALAARVNRVAGRPAIVEEAGDVTLAISIRRTATGFTAHLVATGIRHGDRDFEDAGQSCEGLADGIAVSVALLLDEVAPQQRPPRVGNDVRQAGAPHVAAPPVAPKAPPPRTALDVFAIETASILGRSTLGVEVGAARRVTRLMTVGAGAFFLPNDVEQVTITDKSGTKPVRSVGELELSLVALKVPACFATESNDQSIGFELCGYPTLGLLAGSTSGSLVLTPHVAPWFAMAASALGTGPVVGPLRYLCRADLVVPVTRTTLLGGAFKQAPVGVSAAFGVRALIP
jgi:hypothetical protein